MTPGPDGNVWFTESPNIVGRITPGGKITEFHAGLTGRMYADTSPITLGPDGNLWFAESGRVAGIIGKITPRGEVTEFRKGITGAINDITAGPDGNLWFTQAGSRSGSVGRVTLRGAVRVFHANIRELGGITAGPDGNLWFVGNEPSEVGRITPAGAITVFILFVGNGFPADITTGPDGNLWFTEWGHIGRTSTQPVGGTVPQGLAREATFSIHAPQGYVRAVTVGPDKNLWFAAQNETVFGKVGFITTSGSVTRLPYELGTRTGDFLDGIAAGPDGNIWFTDHGRNGPSTIDRVNLRGGGLPGPPELVDATPFNGGVRVEWRKPIQHGSSAISGYVITAQPTDNDRVPAPKAKSLPKRVGPATLSTEIGGLIEDCHQRYVVSVQAQNAQGLGQRADSDGFRPSGFVGPRKDATYVGPPYVVILLDGISESQPGFTIDAYHPDGGRDKYPGYCPESWNASKHAYQEADFAKTPDGPWSFFHKWNFGEVDNPDNVSVISNGRAVPGHEESTPRTLPGNPDKIPGRTYTNSFMLDAIAAGGAIILPFSYKGYGFGTAPNGDPLFTFYGYSKSQSTPGICTPHCPSIHDDAALLDSEVNAVASVWPRAEIVVIGHSQGGLIAYEWWICSQVTGGICADPGGDLHTTLPLYFFRAFSLDSPINGVCVTFACLGPVSYPPWNSRQALDSIALIADAAQGQPFRFIGTFNDPLAVPTSSGPFHGYGEDVETLKHQMLFNYSYTDSEIDDLCRNPADEGDCGRLAAPSPPDHISECPIPSESEVKRTPQLAWEYNDGHFIVKFSPGDVAYFNNSLGLSY